MTVKFFATYRAITKCASIELDAPDTVLSLLVTLSNRYGEALREKLLSPDAKSLGADAIVLINGRHIEHLNGVRSKLNDTDTVAVFPLVAGG